MPTKSAFSILGLAHKLCLAAEAQGYTPELLNALAEHPSLLDELRKVQLGFSEIKPIIHTIDCDAPPFIPTGWSVHEEEQISRRVRGVYAWGSRLSLHYSTDQMGREVIRGSNLCKQLARHRVLNANVLDYLSAHPGLIPENWKDTDTKVYFWGTIYRDHRGLLVRYLRWDGSGWCWGATVLEEWFGFGDRAAVSAS